MIAEKLLQFLRLTCTHSGEDSNLQTLKNMGCMFRKPNEVDVDLDSASNELDIVDRGAVSIQTEHPILFALRFSPCL